MKKMLVIAMMFVICTVMAAAYAQEELTNRFSLGVVGGGIFPKDNDIDDSWYVGGNAAYGINDYLAVGVESGYTQWKVEESGDDYGDVSAVPLLADLYVRYPLKVGENTLVPYFVGGIGVVFWNYEESSLLTSNGISVDMDPELGIKAGLGVDFFLTKNLALNLEGSYLWSEADMSVSAFGLNAAAEVDTDAWFVTGGIKYYF
jgi:outer membrane protein